MEVQFHAARLAVVQEMIRRHTLDGEKQAACTPDLAVQTKAEATQDS